MSSSTAKILRKPARKIACVSARITRRNLVSLPPSGGCPTFCSVLTGILAMFPPPLAAVKSILVDDHTYAVPATFVETAYYSPPAIELHVGVGSNYVPGQRNCEVHHRAYGHLCVHLEQHPVGGNVFRLGGLRSHFRLHCHRQLQWKSRRALHVAVVLVAFTAFRHRVLACNLVLRRIFPAPFRSFARWTVVWHSKAEYTP